MTTPGFRISPHSGHGGSGKGGDGVLHRHADPAMDALGLAQRTVHLDHAARAGALMQAVDVLGDDRTDPAALLELGEGAVTIVGLRAGSVVGKAADARPRRAPEAPWGRRERIEPEG